MAALGGPHQPAQAVGQGRVAPAEVVEQGHPVGVGAHRHQVAEHLVHRRHRHPVGVEAAVAGVDPDGQGERPPLVGMPERHAHGGVGGAVAGRAAPGPHQGAGPHLVVVGADRSPPWRPRWGRPGARGAGGRGRRPASAWPRPAPPRAAGGAVPATRPPGGGGGNRRGGSPWAGRRPSRGPWSHPQAAVAGEPADGGHLHRPFGGQLDQLGPRPPRARPAPSAPAIPTATPPTAAGRGTCGARRPGRPRRPPRRPARPPPRTARRRRSR